MKLPRNVVEQLRNAVYWTPGLTMTGVIQKCILDCVEELESERGEKFPQRKSDLRPGRPSKTKSDRR